MNLFLGILFTVLIVVVYTSMTIDIINYFKQYNAREREKRKEMKKLSKTSQNRLDDFDMDALDWGWVREDGSGLRVNRSEKDYLESKEALEKRILYLENRIRKLKG